MVPAAGDGQALGAGAAPDDPVDPVPHDAGPELAELLGRVAPGQEVEDVVQDLVGQVGVGRAAADDRGQVVDGPLVQGDHGHDLLGQDVEGVAQVAGRLDGARVHALDDDGGLQQVGPVLGEDAAPAGLADLVAGPADALQAAGHRARRLDLDDEVDGAHVDAQLEAAGGDEGLAGRPASARPRCARRRSRLSEPWWALTSSWPGGGGLPSASAARDSPSRWSSLRRVARRSARRRALTKTMVELCSRISSRSRGCIDGPDGAADRTGGGRALDRLVDDLAEATHVLDGDHDLDLHRSCGCRRRPR